MVTAMAEEAPLVPVPWLETPRENVPGSCSAPWSLKHMLRLSWVRTGFGPCRVEGVAALSCGETDYLA